MADRSFLPAVHVCAYTALVVYEWDTDKARSNVEKHSVDFADAVLVFEDPLALTREGSRFPR